MHQRTHRLTPVSVLLVIHVCLFGFENHLNTFNRFDALTKMMGLVVCMYFFLLSSQHMQWNARHFDKRFEITPLQGLSRTFKSFTELKWSAVINTPCSTITNVIKNHIQRGRLTVWDFREQKRRSINSYFIHPWRERLFRMYFHRLHVYFSRMSDDKKLQ